jgi:HK97 gp10 family phage protein
MATGFSFEVKGLDKLLKVFHELPDRAQQELKDELKITSWEIRDGAKKDAPADEARLKQSISTKETGPTSFEVVAQSFYAGYLEFGTKTKVSVPAGLEDIASQLKGPVSGQGNPIDAIREWVKRKHIAGVYSIKTKKLSKSKKSLANIEQTTFIIWRHIKKFGIAARPYFFKQMKPAEERLRQRLANIIKALVE